MESDKQLRQDKQQYLIDKIINVGYNPMDFKIYCDGIKEDGTLHIKYIIQILTLLIIKH